MFQLTRKNYNNKYNKEPLSAEITQNLLRHNMRITCIIIIINANIYNLKSPLLPFQVGEQN